MQLLLRRACHATNLAEGRKLLLSPRLIHLIARYYDAILAGGVALQEAQPTLAIQMNRDGSSRSGRLPRRIGTTCCCPLAAVAMRTSCGS